MFPPSSIAMFWGALSPSVILPRYTDVGGVAAFSKWGVINIANIKNIFIRRLSINDKINIDTASITILHSPLANKSLKENNNSLVIMIEIFKRKLLLTADIESEIEYQLIKRYGKSIKADIIKVPHHGSKSSSSETFIKTISTHIALISTGKNNFLGLPNKNIINRYYSTKHEIYRTDYNGEIDLTIFPNGFIKIATYSDKI